MKTRHFTLVLLVAAISLFGTACKKKKKVEETPKPKGEVLINEYCTGSEFMSNKDAFRATATGESMDRETAKKKARSNAQSEMAKTINSTMKIVGDNYVNSTEFNNKYGGQLQCGSLSFCLDLHSTSVLDALVLDFHGRAIGWWCAFLTQKWRYQQKNRRGH